MYLFMQEIILATILFLQQTPSATSFYEEWGSFGLALSLLLSAIGWLLYERSKLTTKNEDLQEEVNEMWVLLLDSEKERSKQVESNVQAINTLNEHLEKRLSESQHGNSE